MFKSIIINIFKPEIYKERNLFYLLQFRIALISLQTLYLLTKQAWLIRNYFYCFFFQYIELNLIFHVETIIVKTKKKKKVNLEINHWFIIVQHLMVWFPFPNWRDFLANATKRKEMSGFKALEEKKSLT